MKSIINKKIYPKYEEYKFISEWMKIKENLEKKQTFETFYKKLKENKN
jgi:hypothetical protein